jgi:hypothetical protein
MSQFPQLAALVQSLAFAVWLGGGLAVLSSTRAVFARLPTRREAGDVSGAILERFSSQQVAAAALFGISVLLGGPNASTYFGAGATLLLLVSLPVDQKIRKLRAELGGSTEGLAADDPRRKQFGALHGVSVLLLLGQIVCAGVALAISAAR